MSGAFDFTPEMDGYLYRLATSKWDQDMQGFAVRLSALVANICAAILVTWSEEVVKEWVNIIMLQNYTILICAAVVMARRDLSISDAHFAIVVTASPLSLHFVYSTYRYLRNRPNHLYDKLGSKTDRVVVCILSIMLVI
ncbi:hypothetical protein Moror_5873 [Moniliophthora roreri MCA 2997]|uniref:Uncharacterized protein n=1 Tax=Moniliophthora roreri (strain MCA 2997) TaxID=1381753 RepID=V2Y699_MONRO|nr:hypothetical protein Moror_5873 [Moniliophthora roreri MCA 2997]